MKNIYKLIGFLIIALFFITLLKKLPDNNEVIKNFSNDFLKLNIEGVVIKKYINKSQHSYPMIKVEYLENDNSYQLINLVREATGLYDMIRVGDTIYKEKGSMDVYTIVGQDTVLLRNVAFK